MIKLLQAKEDIYWEDSLPDQKPFCKKGGWYEVISSSKVDLQFKNEEGRAHRWSLSDLDEDFWTVDFDKGFEFERYGNPYEFKEGVVMHMGSVVDDVPVPRVMYLIANGLWHITRFSNQTVIPTPTEEPSHPYENWKKDIGIAKFKRCIGNPCVVFCVVDDINGYLDMKNDTFYYHKKHRGQHTYLCCKVESSLGKGWHFVRENKDSYLVKASTPEAKGMVSKEDVLASFSVPVDNKDTEQQESSKGEGEVSSAEAGVCIDKEGIASDGGKSEYYKIVLPQWLLDRQKEEGYIMLEDLAEIMYGNDFNYTNVFKAQKRMYEMQRGMGKKGNTLEYDATKVKYYVDKQLQVFNRD